MITQELLRRLKAQDITAYNYIYETYGWKLHQYLREKCPDKEVSGEVFRKAINQFCTDLSGPQAADVTENTLYLYADQLLSERRIRPAAPKPAADGKGKVFPGIGQLLLMVLLIAFVAAALWVILGRVMSIELIPGVQLDLGYSWFNQHIAPWF